MPRGTPVPRPCRGPRAEPLGAELLPAPGELLAQWRFMDLLQRAATVAAGLRNEARAKPEGCGRPKKVPLTPSVLQVHPCASLSM